MSAIARLGRPPRPSLFVLLVAALPLAAPAASAKEATPASAPTTEDNAMPTLPQTGDPA